jgi:hypothetical protein
MPGRGRVSERERLLGEWWLAEQEIKRDWQLLPETAAAGRIMGQMERQHRALARLGYLPARCA